MTPRANAVLNALIQFQKPSDRPVSKSFHTQSPHKFYGHVAYDFENLKFHFQLPESISLSVYLLFRLI